MRELSALVQNQNSEDTWRYSDYSNQQNPKPQTFMFAIIGYKGQYWKYFWEIMQGRGLINRLRSF